ncbi:DinB family protein [Mycobacterium kubicae]|uniref:DinB family protein n=1 Tax=Mycobacterium kubicae TaxID=120959 RepID=UPI0007FB72D6|nr:DinB family protein [Mycobacterium kubicae]OBK56595.1 hypothetical protein A5657_09305 [Mycobacterium kubicae]
MPALAPPVADERSALREFLAYHQSAYFAVSYGLTDEQARATPTVSALSIGGLVKHATGMQRTWITRASAAADAAPADPPLAEVARRLADEHVMRPDETLDGLLGALREQNAASLRLVETADLDAPVRLPQNVPWFQENLRTTSVRWVIMQVINELARHAGHADIVRESIDGATMYELIAAVEEWEPGGWVTPWRRPGR